MRRIDLIHFLENKLPEQVKSVSALSGGDINQAYRVETTEKQYVVKVNSASEFPSMFSKEARGLQLLQAAVRTPQVIEVFYEQNDQFLILEFIEQATATNQFWQNFGESLAKLHQMKNQQFGLDHDNFIGSLIQINDLMSSWLDFFIQKRIEPMIRLGLDSGLLARANILKFNRFFKVLPNLLPENQVSLLHGDLWSGNLMCDADQKAVYIDPAVYFGHREVDIAMTKMFGGFNEFYLDVYQEIYPLENGWSDRLDIYNLYPRLVHLNLFGVSYLSGINSVLNRYA